jgi:hypothetical protein
MLSEVGNSALFLRGVQDGKDLDAPLSYIHSVMRHDVANIEAKKSDNSHKLTALSKSETRP